MHGHSWWILLSDSARFALDRRTRANANTQCFIPRQIINNRAARSFRYTVLPVGSRSRLRSYTACPILFPASPITLVSGPRASLRRTSPSPPRWFGCSSGHPVWALARYPRVACSCALDPSPAWDSAMTTNKIGAKFGIALKFFQFLKKLPVGSINSLVDWLLSVWKREKNALPPNAHSLYTNQNVILRPGRRKPIFCLIPFSQTTENRLTLAIFFI